MTIEAVRKPMVGIYHKAPRVTKRIRIKIILPYSRIRVATLELRRVNAGREHKTIYAWVTKRGKA